MTLVSSFVTFQLFYSGFLGLAYRYEGHDVDGASAACGCCDGYANLQNMAKQTRPAVVASCGDDGGGGWAQKLSLTRTLNVGISGQLRRWPLSLLHAPKAEAAALVRGWGHRKERNA
jgi:hypothetical protein